MMIGLDLDNTIACYDQVFPALAARRGWAAPTGGWTKATLRDFLRAAGREAEWTRMQGEAYGPAMAGARPFPGLLEFLAAARAAGVGLCIISHRTRHPLDGPSHDLHGAARTWLESSVVVHPERGVPPDQVFLEEERAGKLRRIAERGCTHFVDDLPEFLGDAQFPTGVMRGLFDPEGRHGPDERWRSWSSWTEAWDLLPAGGLAALAERLLDEAGLGALRRIDSWRGKGRNNRLYGLEAERGRAVLKRYFRDPADGRDRLRAEFDFARCAWGAGLRELPRPLALDEAAGLGLYAWVEGRTLTAADIDAGAVAQAWSFFQRLNHRRGEVCAQDLGNASEACFSLAEHLDCIARRLLALASGEVAEPVRRYTRERLLPAFDQHAAAARAGAADGGDPRSGWGARAPAKRVGDLTPSDRCLSPSDFGFHNALLGPTGLVFLDFEYAGWDDPAKAVCDFFCQPELPVSRVHLPLALAAAGGQAALAARVRALLPLYGLKWCAIMLNEFLPAGARRRRFAAAEPHPDMAQRLARVEAYREGLAR